MAARIALPVRLARAGRTRAAGLPALRGRLRLPASGRVTPSLRIGAAILLVPMQ